MQLVEAKKILFICSANKMRSYTAERVYQRDDRYQVRSRGTERGARIKVTAGDIGWADVIFTMEPKHTQRLRSKFGEQLMGRILITLFIEDIYEPMEPALIDELNFKLTPYIGFPSCA